MKRPMAGNTFSEVPGQVHYKVKSGLSQRTEKEKVERRHVWRWSLTESKAKFDTILYPTQDEAARFTL